jgi:leucyl aminopeptidase
VWGHKEDTELAQTTLSAIYCADIARDLASEPSNIMGGPVGFIERAKGLFKRDMKRVKIKILSMDELKQHGMNLIVAMGQGAANEPRMLVIDYTPDGHKKTSDPVVCIAGKGVCYDTGGYDIKPTMYGMNTDKTGASIAVACVHHSVKHMPSKKTRVIAVCPLIENRVSANAVLPGDVIKAYNGKTVEIVDTDAEGRVIIADALAYICSTYEADIIIDLGTYTGFASRLHCGASFVYYTEMEALVKKLENMPRTTCERGIRLPPWKEFIEYTKGSIADLKNISSECIGDSSMAAMFLMNFVDIKNRNKWIHFDITDNHSKPPTVGVCNSTATIIEIISSIKSRVGKI